MSDPLPDCSRLERGAPDYPRRLVERLGSDAPESLVARGDASLLRRPLTALFCSVRVPPELVLPTYDLARALRDAGSAVIGGFQSPLERDCLEHLLRGRHPVVLAPARAVATMRLPRSWQAALEEGRLLLVGPFERERRPSQALTARRNRLVAALAERIWVAHARPGGRLLRVVAEALARGTPVHCLPHAANHDLLLMGATAAAAGRAH